MENAGTTVDCKKVVCSSHICHSVDNKHAIFIKWVPTPSC